MTTITCIEREVLGVVTSSLRKLIYLMKMYKNDKNYQVRVDKTLSKEFKVITCFKQGDTLTAIIYSNRKI